MLGSWPVPRSDVEIFGRCLVGEGGSVGGGAVSFVLAGLCDARYIDGGGVCRSVREVLFAIPSLYVLAIARSGRESDCVV